MVAAEHWMVLQSRITFEHFEGCSILRVVVTLFLYTFHSYTTTVLSCGCDKPIRRRRCVVRFQFWQLAMCLHCVYFSGISN